MRKQPRPDNIGSVILTISIVLTVLFFILTGCVSAKKYKALQNQNKVLKAQIKDTENFYRDALLEAQKRK